MSKKEDQERKPFSNLCLDDTGTPNRKAICFIGNQGEDGERDTSVSCEPAAELVSEGRVSERRG